MSKLTQRGDTIVEALIATAIIGMTIGLAYGIANRSIRAARQAQERVEAVKIAESQLEGLKAITSNEDNGDNSQAFYSATAFCLNEANQRVNLGWATVPNLASDSLSTTNYPTDCRKDPDQRYHVAIKATDILNNGSRYQFAITVRWFGFGNLQKEEVNVEYRLHPL